MMLESLGGTGPLIQVSSGVTGTSLIIESQDIFPQSNRFLNILSSGTGTNITIGAQSIRGTGLLANIEPGTFGLVHIKSQRIVGGDNNLGMFQVGGNMTLELNAQKFTCISVNTQAIRINGGGNNTIVLDQALLLGGLMGTTGGFDLSVQMKTNQIMGGSTGTSLLDINGGIISVWAQNFQYNTAAPAYPIVHGPNGQFLSFETSTFLANSFLSPPSYAQNGFNNITGTMDIKIGTSLVFGTLINSTNNGNVSLFGDLINVDLSNSPPGTPGIVTFGNVNLNVLTLGISQLVDAPAILLNENASMTAFCGSLNVGGTNCDAILINTGSNCRFSFEDVFCNSRGLGMTGSATVSFNCGLFSSFEDAITVFDGQLYANINNLLSNSGSAIHVLNTGGMDASIQNLNGAGSTPPILIEVANTGKSVNLSGDVFVCTGNSQACIDVRGVSSHSINVNTLDCRFGATGCVRLLEDASLSLNADTIIGAPFDQMILHNSTGELNLEFGTLECTSSSLTPIAILAQNGLSTVNGGRLTNITDPPPINGTKIGCRVEGSAEFNSYIGTIEADSNCLSAGTTGPIMFRVDQATTYNDGTIVGPTGASSVIFVNSGDTGAIYYYGGHLETPGPNTVQYDILTGRHDSLLNSTLISTVSSIISNTPMELTTQPSIANTIPDIVNIIYHPPGLIFIDPAIV